MGLSIKNGQTKAFNLRIKVKYEIRYKYQKFLYIKLNLY